MPSYVCVNFYSALEDADRHASRNARLYMAPGVGHCAGGAGADSIDLLNMMAKWGREQRRAGFACQPCHCLEACSRRGGRHRWCSIHTAAVPLPYSALLGRERFGGVLNLNTRFSFHPVGQGMFSTGALSTHEPLSPSFWWAGAARPASDLGAWPGSGSLLKNSSLNSRNAHYTR